VARVRQRRMDAGSALARQLRRHGRARPHRRPPVLAAPDAQLQACPHPGFPPRVQPGLSRPDLLRTARAEFLPGRRRSRRPGRRRRLPDPARAEPRARTGDVACARLAAAVAPARPAGRRARVPRPLPEPDRRRLRIHRRWQRRDLPVRQRIRVGDAAGRRVPDRLAPAAVDARLPRPRLGEDPQPRRPHRGFRPAVLPERPVRPRARRALARQRRLLSHGGDDLARRRRPGGHIRPGRRARRVPDPGGRPARGALADRPEPARRADGIRRIPGSGTPLSGGGRMEW